MTTSPDDKLTTPREPQQGDVIRWHDGGDLDWVIRVAPDSDAVFMLNEGVVTFDIAKDSADFITNTDSLAEFLRICEGDES